MHHAQADSEDAAAASDITFQAYIGAELYNKRMFPHGCPSYQKAFVKLFKVEKGRKRLTLIDSQFFNNRDGFGFMLRNLAKGEYQIHFKKYSQSFDVFDFTVRMYAEQQVKIVDDEEANIKKVNLTAAMIAKIPKINDATIENPSDKAAMPTNPIPGAPPIPEGGAAKKEVEGEAKKSGGPAIAFRQPVGQEDDKSKSKPEATKQEQSPKNASDIAPPAPAVKPLSTVQLSTRVSK